MPKKEWNKKLVALLEEIAYLEDLRGTEYRPMAYRRAATAIETLGMDIGRLYKSQGFKGIQKIQGVGKSIAQKAEEYIRTKKIAYRDELWKKTVLRQIVTYFFETKGVSLAALKRRARAENIIYGKYAKSARELFLLAGSVEKAKMAIKKVGEWAVSRGLDYSLDTVIKRWLELDRLKPKKAVRKAFYQGDPMVWSETKKKWFVVTPDNEWLEFADDESKMEWRIVQ